MPAQAAETKAALKGKRKRNTSSNARGGAPGRTKLTPARIAEIVALHDSTETPSSHRQGHIEIDGKWVEITSDVLCDLMRRARQDGLVVSVPGAATPP